MFRAMLRGLLAHKLRLVLSALAVVLGTMFMSAAFVAGDTMAKGFENLFTTVNENLDVQVTAENDAPKSEQGNEVVTAFVDQATVDKIAAVPGAARTTPQVGTDGARVVGKNGKVVASNGPPRFGIGWVEDDSLVRLRDGRPPTGPDDIAINAGLAKTTGYQVGDRVDVITLKPRKTFTLVGIFGYEGGRDSLGGETTVAFSMPTAQDLLIGAPGKFTNVDVQAASGVSQAELKTRIAAAVGPNYTVKTGEETAKDQASETASFVSILKGGLTGFAIIGLFTGAFLIFNTFSMLVAQRTRELALYRSFGASRGQVNRSVLLESVLLGLMASLVGLGVGVGVGYLLRQLLESFANANLPVSGVVLRPYVVIVTLLVGTAFTVVAALIPALRASRVAPIAAMREAATPDKPLGRLTAIGGVVFGAGVLLLALKLTDVVKDALWWMLGGGAALAFLGVAMLAPSVARPVTSVLGRALSWAVPGRLGTRNTGRNPRRTAVTAAALMIGVTLATGAGVFAASAKSGISNVFNNDLDAQLILSTDFTGTGQAGFEPSLVDKMKAIPGVQTALAGQADSVRVGGRTLTIIATDVGAAKVIFKMTPKEGDLRTLNAGEIVVDTDTAKKRGWKLGDTVPVQTARGGDYGEKIVGIYETNNIANGPILNTADATTFRSPFAQQGYVKVADDGQVGAVKSQLDALVKDNPEVTVSDRSGVIKQSSQFLNIVLTILNVLLGLTILVAVLGVINTLLLSVFERTREIGLIRAIGMNRRQLGWMVTVESILISVFGVLLGVAAGVALGIAIVQAVGTDFLKLTMPWGYLAATLILALVAGVLAAILPAIRAARLNVLEAIAYE
ncbi:MAG TPA: FtsX-like permease family protein [Micromonosporaceae bacterium]|jgi:putative ABC transport system permease protein